MTVMCNKNCPEELYERLEHQEKPIIKLTDKIDKLETLLMLRKIEKYL